MTHRGGQTARFRFDGGSTIDNHADYAVASGQTA